MVKIRNSIDLPSKYGVLKIVSFDELRDGKENVAVYPS